MTTKEFLKILREMGVKNSRIKDGYLTIIDEQHAPLAIIDMDSEFLIETTLLFSECSYVWKKELFCLFLEYISTPVEDRKEAKYILRFKQRNLIEDKHCVYLTYIKAQSKYIIGSSMETKDHKTRFTKSEIENIPQCIGELFDVINEKELE